MKKDIYLISHLYKVARKGANSAQKDFGKKESNWQWNEEVVFKQKISKKDSLSAAVILGLHQKKVIRSSMNPTATFEELYNYFYENGYKEYLDRVKQAEEIVAQAVEEAMKEMKETNTDPTTFHFPKAEDFEKKEEHLQVSFGAMPPNPAYMGMTAEELKAAMERDAMGFTPINVEQTNE